MISEKISGYDWSFFYLLHAIINNAFMFSELIFLLEEMEESSAA